MSYDFSIDKVEAKEIRSRKTDTIYISISVAVAGHETRTLSRRIGDKGKGTFYPDMVLRDVPVADNEIAVFSYIIINNGRGDPDVAERLLRGAATQLAETGANAVRDVVTTAAGATAGAALGALVGSPVPIVGTFVGAALGGLTAKLLGSLIDMVDPNCDGPLAAGTHIFPGVSLAGGSPVSQCDHNPGIDSPAGCGANSNYFTTWRVTKKT